MNTKRIPLRAASPLAPGAFAWVVEERVGEGTSGEVWRARQRSSGELAALKVSRGGDGDMLREASVLARAQRRWGPRLLDVGIVPDSRDGAVALPPGARFVATTWAEGKPLDPHALG